MKNALSMILFAVFLLTLAACASTDSPDTTQPKADPTNQLTASPESNPSESPSDIEEEQTTSLMIGDMIGDWACVFEDDGSDGTLYVFDTNGQPEVVAFSCPDYGTYYSPVAGSSFIDNILTVELQSGLIMALRYAGQDKLAGTYTMPNGDIWDVEFNRISKTPSGPESISKPEPLTDADRVQKLKDYNNYNDDSVLIPFTYTLNQRAEMQTIIDQYGLDAITEGKNDVELMLVLLNWVCDNFKHNGSAMPPEQHDAVSVINYAIDNPGINCRMVSIILAELCRTYGIEAKHITCMPIERIFGDCHVVVHAYSKELNQWIMLDPTYRLILQNEDGEYVNLPMLRQSIIDGEELIPNADAGWNGNSFSVTDYMAYMAKNTFRFSCATDFHFGAEDEVDGNVSNMLVPLNYAEKVNGNISTSDKEFWKLP